MEFDEVRIDTELKPITAVIRNDLIEISQGELKFEVIRNGKKKRTRTPGHCVPIDMIIGGDNANFHDLTSKAKYKDGILIEFPLGGLMLIHLTMNSREWLKWQQ